MRSALHASLLILSAAWPSVAAAQRENADAKDSAHSRLPGAIWPRHTIDDTSKGADGVRLADIDGDGFTDIVTGWEEGGVVRVYTHPGLANVRDPWPKQTVGKVRSPEDAVFCDLDGDGRLDVVSACEGSTKTLFFHWAPENRDAPWKTESVPGMANRQAWMYVLPVEMDGRFGTDLLVGSKGAGAAIGWLACPEAPRRVGDWQYHQLREAGWIMSIEAADMDGDGDEDVLFSDRRGARSGVYWLERGQGWKEHAIGAVREEAMFLDVCDLDGDGRLDVAAAVKSRSLVLFTQSAEPSWETKILGMPERFLGTAKAVRAGDLDGDGDVDLAGSCEGADSGRSGVFWVENRGKDSWHFRELGGPEGIKFDHLKLLDLDGDGDLDVLTCEERAGLGVIWYENPLP